MAETETKDNTAPELVEAKDPEPAAADSVAAVTESFMKRIDELQKQMTDERKAHEDEIKQIISSINSTGTKKKSDLDVAVEKATAKVNKFRK